jgi:hypothetical protein
MFYVFRVFTMLKADLKSTIQVGKRFLEKKNVLKDHLINFYETLHWGKVNFKRQPYNHFLFVFLDRKKFILFYFVKYWEKTI